MADQRALAERVKVTAFLRPRKQQRKTRQGKQKNKETDHSTRRALKSFKNRYDSCKKKPPRVTPKRFLDSHKKLA
jgi:uridine kinase